VHTIMHTFCVKLLKSEKRTLVGHAAAAVS